MSTSLNDTVSEIYNELCKLNDAKINDAVNSRSRLKRLLTNPRVLIWLVKRALMYKFNDYGKIYSRNKNLFNRVNNEPNNFKPVYKKFPDLKIAVYTSITGGYDDLKDPFYVDDNLDYYAFTDEHTHVHSSVWKEIKIIGCPENLSNAQKNRYVKLNADDFLKLTGRDYDYSIYIDGTIRITCDIKPLVYSLHDSGKSLALHMHSVRDCVYMEAVALFIFGILNYDDVKKQMDVYKSEGFPENFGLFENPVMIRKSHDSELNSIMLDWWAQLNKYTVRDQLSLPYVLWKHGLDKSYVFSLGNNFNKNFYFVKYPHAKKFEREVIFG